MYGGLEKMEVPIKGASLSFFLRCCDVKIQDRLSNVSLHHSDMLFASHTFRPMGVHMEKRAQTSKPMPFGPKKGLWQI